ncbi:hemicentin-1-like [Scyliorhinus canicula]|uniref:hemicentin-1-like n=1 Tax=Scyliorhinus canicula TaxID=7830 RepID=UPI0018F6909A|nr:hemicentin-1-like [Scyliorhinus canicula]
MIGKSYFLLSLLQVVLSQEWKCDTPREVTAQEGLCAQIPCHYSYPSHLENQPRVGIWYNNDEWGTQSSIFHSKDHNQELSQFRHRTRLSGDLHNGDCSLIINNIRRQDAGPYYFRIEFDNRNRYSYYPVTQLHVSDFTDKPTIFPAEIIAGKPVDIRCTFNTMCSGTTPALTWDTPTDVPGSVSNTVIQHGITLTYTSVLSLTPSLKHHRQTLTCRLRYPSVSSERTLVLTVQYAPQDLSMTSLDMIKTSLINIIEGASTRIICSVSSFPASNLTWRRLHVTMNRTRSNNELWLVIPRVTSRDTGDYECAAENEHGAVKGSITITVEHAPRNLSMTSFDMINTSLINVIEGNSAEIICFVESFPASNLMWRHLNVTMNRTSSNNELWLVIPHVTSRDTGDYECVAENKHGAVEGSITITVQYVPQNLSITSLDMINTSLINIIEGNSTVIICSVESSPASNLTWRHLNVTMNRTSSNNELWLVIPHVTSRDTGDYECAAENEHGAVEGTITITVEHTPRNLSITSLDMINASLINIIEGNSAVIICSVESFPASNLTWRHRNVTMNRTSSNNELWLVIPRVTSRDTGGYECAAENEHGAVEGSITIAVEYAPRNLSMTSFDMINTSLINVIEGNSAEIICFVESFPASNLTWGHLNVTMNRTSSNNELWLVIPHVTSRDTGGYECAAENEHGAVEGTITITVEHAPRNLSITSHDMINASLINIIEGNSTVIICSVESLPTSNLTWRHLHVTMNRTRSNNELWLVIPHVTSRDTGDYECAAENEHGAVEGSITITVEHTPQNLSMTSIDMINASWINIIEGNPTVIICSVKSFPVSNLMWRHVNVTMNRTSSNNELCLVIPHVTSRDTGDYECVAENEHGAVEGSITITVEHAPRNLSMSFLDMVNSSWINIIVGNSTVIICSVASFPASNMTWQHLNVTMNRTSSNNELWLVIPHVTSRDTGDYECAAENEHGAVEGSITITVEYPPQETMVSISTSPDGIREGSNITLTCSSESVPPISHYTWFRIEGNTSIQLNTSSRFLSFTPVTRENDGSFYCTVRNPLGNSTSKITHLDVQYKPMISRESDCTMRSEEVICVCVANSNPPGDLTWHLPLANISGNHTHGRLVSRHVRDGHLVIGSLILTGPQGEEAVMASCSVQNPHGESTFKMSLWVKGRDSSERTIGLLTAGIMLNVFVAGILTFMYVRKRKTATEDRVSEISDIELSPSPLTVNHQGKQNMLLTDPRNTPREATKEVEAPILQDLSEGPVGEASGHGKPDNPTDLLYVNPQILRVPTSDRLSTGKEKSADNHEKEKTRGRPPGLWPLTAAEQRALDLISWPGDTAVTKAEVGIG